MTALLITFKRPNGRGNLHSVVTPACDSLLDFLALLDTENIRPRDVVAIREAMPGDKEQYGMLRETI